jgi:cytochrome P450
MAGWEQLDAYIDDMVAYRRNALTDDLISDLIRAEDDGDRLTPDELRMLAAVLLTAGTDTTRNQLAAAVQVLFASNASDGYSKNSKNTDKRWRTTTRHPFRPVG